MAGGAAVANDGYGNKGVFHKHNIRGTLFCGVFVLGAILYGYDGTYFTGILAMDTFKRDFGTLTSAGTYVIDAKYQSLFASIVQAGEFVGALAAGFIGNRSGRKGAMLVAISVVAFGAILQLIVTGNLPLLVVGRLILGMGVGIISNCTTLYLSEIPPSSIRGSMVSSWQLFLALGQVLGAGIAQGTKDYESTFSYRMPIALNIAICLLIFIGLFFIPESPRWFVSKNRDDDAARALERVHKGDPDTDVAKELRHMTHAREAEIAESGGSTSWSELFVGVERRKLIAVFGILVCQQISGVQFIFSYGTVFFESIGFNNAFTVTIITDIVEVVGVLVSFFLVNRIGRRPLLLWTTVMMAALLLVCGILGTIKDPSKAVNSAIASMIIIYVFFFNLAWGPLAWVVATELAGGRNRSRIMSVGTAAFWVAAWAVTFTLPYLYNTGDGAGLGPMVGFIYFGGAVISYVFVYYMIPETLGRSLEEYVAFADLDLGRRLTSTFYRRVNMLLELNVPTRAWKEYHAHLDGQRVEPDVTDAKASAPKQRFLEDVADENTAKHFEA
ncbi:MFS transporter, SP family, sugar:H+ symporter, partial [Phenoliferia sp. Uapishka_3]